MFINRVNPSKERKNFMNYKEFAKRANTGDIILFRGYATESKLQRGFTSADYDHVTKLNCIVSHFSPDGNHLPGKT